MAKYTQEFKLEVVQFYLTRGCGYRFAANKFKVKHDTVRLWIENYQQYGLDGLKVLTSKATYTPEFKLQAVQLVLEGKTIHEVRRLLNVSNRSIIRNWLSSYQKHGIDGLKAKPRGPIGKKQPTSMPKIHKQQPTKDDKNKSQQELIEEIAYLRAENALLKKRNALGLGERTQKVTK